MLTIITAGLLAVATLSTASPTYSARTDTTETIILPAVTGTVFRQWNGGATYYYTRPDTMEIGYWYSISPPTSVTWHGWLRFDLSGLPDSAEFDAAQLHFYLFRDTLGAPSYRLTGFPDYTGGTESLYNAVLTSVGISDTSQAHRGWNTTEINPAGLELLNSCLQEDRAHIGIRNDGPLADGEAYGLGGPDSLRPYLELTYHTAVSEAPGPCPQASSFRIQPNPAPARSRVRLSLPKAHPADISVHDITGREVWSKRLAGDRTGTVQLPLLPSGVYLVRLEHSSLGIDHLSLSSKLVVHR